MSKGKQLREGLTGACPWYAIGDHEVPHSGWMVCYSELDDTNQILLDLVSHYWYTLRLVNVWSSWKAAASPAAFFFFASWRNKSLMEPPMTPLQDPDSWARIMFTANPFRINTCKSA